MDSTLHRAEMSTESVAWPIADPALTQELLDLVQQASRHRQLHKGANESIKTLNRRTSELIVLASDAKPIAVVLPLPLLCEDKNIPFVYIPSKAALGRACGVSRPVISASITANEASDLSGLVKNMRERIERLVM